MSKSVNYDPKFAAKIQNSVDQVKNGLTRIVSLEDLSENKFKDDDAEFVAMILEGEEHIKAGKGVKVDIDHLF